MARKSEMNFLQIACVITRNVLKLKDCFQSKKRQKKNTFFFHDVEKYRETYVKKLSSLTQ